jgi:hypothetical protein
MKRGVVAGLLAGGVVAVWFFVLDVLAGHPLLTPAALGSSLLFARTTVEFSARTIVAYCVFHFALFVIGGLMYSWVADRLERRPSFGLFALLALILLEALTIAIVAGMAQWGLGSFGVWSVTIGNVIAIAVMAGYLWATHPRLHGITDNPQRA